MTDRGRMQSGLFMIALGSGVLVAWWSGAFAMLGETLAEYIRSGPAGGGSKGLGGVPKTTGNFVPTAVLDPSQVVDLRTH